MKKITLLCSLLFAFSSINGQVILTNNFDLALDWTVAHPTGVSTNAGWTQLATGNAGFPSVAVSPFAGAGMARFNSYSISTTGGINTYELNSPSFALTGGSYRVTFKMFRDSGYATTNDNLELFINTVSGSAGGTSLGIVNRPIGSAPVVSTNGWYSYTFLIPGNPTGNRFVSFLATSQFGNNIFIDEVVIENVPGCAEPTALTSSLVTSNSSTVSWTAPTVAPANGYEYYVATSSTLPSLSQTPTGSTAAGIVTTNLSGLMPATTYYFFVRSICSITSKSPWSSPVSFTTLCVPVTAFSENFDASTSFPTCWARVGTGGNAYPQASTSASSAPNNLYIYSTSSTDQGVVSTIPVSNLGAGTNRFKFNIRGNFTAGDALDIGYLTNQTDATSFVVLTTVTASTLTNTPFTYAPPAGSYSNFPAIRHTGTLGYSILIDDFVWEPIPSCAEPTAILSSAITTTSATLSWTAPTVAPANGYEYINTTSTVPPTPTSTPTGSVGAGITTTSITGLTQATTYYFYVRSICSITSSSPWTATSYSTVTPPPANDDCANAILLTAGATVTSNPLTGNTTSATDTPGLTTTCTANKNSDVWYKVVVPASGSLTLETTAVAGSLLTDTVISVLSTCGGTELGCNDDTVGGADAFSKVILTGQTAGSTVYVGVWRYGTSTGVGQFKISAYDASLSSASFNSENFSYYPNPVTDILNLKYSESISTISVVNLLGQTVLNKTINQNEIQLDLTSLPTGTYLVKVTSDNLVKTIKINKL